MTLTLKVNTRNDLHLPAALLRHLNLGKDRILRVETKGNIAILIPVDIEPRYSSKELAGLDHLHEDERRKGWIPLDSPKKIDRLLK